MVRQTTISEKIACTGIGLHSGAPVQLTLHPARANTGIVLERTDGAHPVEVAARSEAVRSTRFATTVGRGAATVGTVEHLLAALYGLGVDNVRIQVDGPEIPIMDGSAAPFVYLVRQAGIFEQEALRQVIRVTRPIEVTDGDRRIRVEPARSLRVSYGIDFAHPVIGRQEIANLELDARTFEREIGRARTFGFLHEVDAMWKAGLARGGSLDNTIVLDGERVMNEGGLRWKDEFVRHKVLDLVGDLALLGLPLLGHVHVERGGHALHQKLVAAIRDSAAAAAVREVATSDAAFPIPRVATA